ncbi:hypothetical protein OROGR_015187 [Orobanche gracilis]
MSCQVATPHWLNTIQPSGWFSRESPPGHRTRIFE